MYIYKWFCIRYCTMMTFVECKRGGLGCGWDMDCVLFPNAEMWKTSSRSKKCVKETDTETYTHTYCAHIQQQQQQKNKAKAREQSTREQKSLVSTISWLGVVGSVDPPAAIKQSCSFFSFPSPFTQSSFQMGDCRVVGLLVNAQHFPTSRSSICSSSSSVGLQQGFVQRSNEKQWQQQQQLPTREGCPQKVAARKKSMLTRRKGKILGMGVGEAAAAAAAATTPPHKEGGHERFDGKEMHKRLFEYHKGGQTRPARPIPVDNLDVLLFQVLLLLLLLLLFPFFPLLPCPFSLQSLQPSCLL